MIKYALKCGEGHEFDSWFRDSASYDTLSAAGQISCAVCGGTDVKKSIMAPSVGTSDRGDVSEADTGALSAPASPAEAALRKMQEHVRDNSDYVGGEFADEARRIHLGEADARAIWGEASLNDAKDLHDEGIPVAPLPWMRRRTD